MRSARGMRGHAEIVRHIVDSGVPVMGHLGLTPNLSTCSEGRRCRPAPTQPPRSSRRKPSSFRRPALSRSSWNACHPKLPDKVTDMLRIPTIGIAAGRDVSGQALVYQELLGLN